MDKKQAGVGRKFSLTILSLGMTFYLAVTEKLTSEWGLAIAAILAFYNGFNVAQKYVDARRTNIELDRMEQDNYYRYDEPSWHRERRY